MKHLGIKYSLAGLALSALAVALPVRADYPSTVLGQNPLGYWSLNETIVPQSVVANNYPGSSLGSSANGSYNNLPVRGLTGPFAGSVGIQFNGVSQTVTTPYQAGLNPAAFTIETWVKPASAAVSGGLLCVASSVHAATPRAGWLIYQSDGTAAGAGGVGWYLRTYNQNANAFSIGLLAPQAVTTTAWTHLVFTYDGATAQAYLNGVPVGSASGVMVTNFDSQFSIAERSDGSFPWPGQVAELAYYGAALSATDVANHYAVSQNAPATYASTIEANNPLLYYRFTEQPDPMAANSGSLGAAAAGTYLYAAQPGLPGPLPTSTPVGFPGFSAGNKSVGFPGTNGPGSVFIPPLNLNTNAVTITAWVRPDNGGNPQTPGAGLVICDGGTTTSTGLAIDRSDGTLLAYHWAGLGSANASQSGLTLPDGEWSFVAMAVQPTFTTLYVMNHQFAFGSGVFVNDANSANQAFDAPLLIGSDGGTNAFVGEIDSVAVFNRTLSSGEVFTEYAAAAGGIPPQIFTDVQAPSNTIFAGDPVILSVDAGGTPPLAYVWRKGGTAIPGATTNVFEITNSAVGDTGTYDVLVSNGSGSTPSSQVPITVNPATAPVVSQGPVGRTLYPGGTLGLFVVASGGGIHYQWTLNGSPISGATNSAYNVASAGVTNGGSYAVNVSNAHGSTTAGPTTVTVVSPVAGSYESIVVGDRPLSWWRLDESAPASDGLPMLDGMGRNDGYYTNTSTGSVWLGAPGIPRSTSDTALASDGTVKFLGVVPYSPALGSTEFTIEAWAKITNSSANYCPVSFYSPSVKGGEFPYFDAGAGNWRAAIGAGTASYLFYYLGDAPDTQYVSNKWVHVAMTYSAANGLRWFVDGQWNGGSYGNFTRNGSDPLLIGGVDPSTINYHLNGTVDEVAFYTNALSVAQIQTHFYVGLYGSNSAPFFTLQPVSQGLTVSNAANFTAFAESSTPINYQWLRNGVPLAGQTTTALSITSVGFADVGTYQLQASNVNAATLSSPATLTVSPLPSFVNATNNLVLHLRFDGTYTDSSGRGNDASAPAGSPPFLAGRIGQAVHIAASAGNSYLVVADNSGDLTFDATTSFSVGLWLRYTGTAGFNDCPIIGNAVGSTYQQGWVLTEDSNQFEVSLADTANSGTYVKDPAGGPALNDGAWHSLIAVVDRTQGLAFAYVDGTQVVSWSIADLGTLEYGNALTIGQDPTGNYGVPATFDLDDLAIWRRPVSSTEAYAIYYVGQSGTSIDTYGSVKLFLTQSTTGLILSWQAGTLLSAPSVNGPWTSVSGAVPPNYSVPLGSGNLFYRVKL